MLSKDGILPNPKTSKVRDWPIPKSVKEVHSFLRLASYYKRFIPQFAKWANPLHDLIHPITTKKKCAGTKLPLLSTNLPPFKWDSEHQESFDRIKEALTSSPILAYPDYTKHLSLRLTHLSRDWVLSYHRRMMLEISASFHMPVIHPNCTKGPCKATAQPN